MVVDDDQGFRSMIRDWLLDEGIEVVAEAEDGVVAVALAGERHPDIVLMDLQMPRMNGFEAARRIHAEQPGPQIIVLSAYGGPALKQAAEDAGVNWFVEKDCPPDVLWRTIRFAWTFKLDLEGRGAAAS
jgi:DNA-binding NarL/FixJ family response regulator